MRLPPGAPPEIPPISVAARMMEAKAGRYAPAVDDDTLGEAWEA